VALINYSEDEDGTEFPSTSVPASRGRDV